MMRIEITDRKKTYEAMGFVEALIAIMIAGMASVVLMGIAADTLKEAVQNERIDKMTEYAVEGGNMAKSAVANTENLPFSPTVENCYIPVPDPGGSGSYTFYTTSIGYWSQPARNLIIYNVIQRNLIPANAPRVLEDDGEESQFIRIACIRQNPGKQYLIVRIGVAHLLSKGRVTNDTDIKDYFYTTTINL